MASPTPKDPLEELPKEELIKKCRQFLAIAQKAKQAKDTINDENKTILKRLEESEKGLQAMQEMLNVLTQQKLQLVTENDNLAKQIKSCHQNLQDMDTEIKHYQRQVKRLTDENEYLISHLDDLEKRIEELNKIGEQQREELLELEKYNASLNKQEDNEIDTDKQEDNKIDTDKQKDNEINTNIQQENDRECLEDKFESISSALQEKEEEIKQLREEIENLKTKNEQIDHLKNFCQLKNTEIENLEIINYKLNETVNTNNDLISNLKKELDDTKNAKKHYNDKFKSYHSKLVKVYTDLKELKKCRNSLLLVVQDYSKYINKWQTDIRIVSEKYLNEIKSRDSQIEILKSKVDLLELENNKENNRLIEEVTKLKNHEEINLRIKEEYEKELFEIQNQLSLSKRENVELLKEMNIMNQALKERGETISKQQENNQELLRKIQGLEQDGANHNKQKSKLEEEIADLKTKTIKEEHDSQLDEKNEKIRNLELEVQQLRESFNNSRDNQDGGYCESETMSTSTISKIDDAARLRDLEGSWEERYSKLRTLALKLKGKVKEQNEQLVQERTDKTEIQNKLASINKNLQSVQSEYDKIQDQFDLLNEDNKKKNKSIELLTADNEKIKLEFVKSSEKVSKLQSELESLRKEKIGSSSAVKQYSNQIQNLKKELEDGENKIKELENKISKLETEYQNEIKLHNSTKEKLLKLEKEMKKTSVLSLEMEDYERSLKDMSQKLEKKNEIINNLQEKSTTQESTIIALQNQIKTFEEKVLEDETQCQSLEKQLLESQTKTSAAEAALAQKENRIREVIKTLEDYKIRSEEENGELSQTVTQNQKELEQLRIEKMHLKSLILGLEEKIKDLTTTSEDRQLELTHLRNEFSNYKVRAQSVLRQNQTRDITLEERLSEEVNELKAQNELLENKIREITSELEILSNKFEQTSVEKSQALVQCDEFKELLTKEKKDNQNLLQRQQQLIAEHKEELRAQKIHADTLTQCYKQQLSEQEDRYTKEINELRACQLQTNLTSKTEDIDIASMPREDAEGSESVESANQYSKSIISLDKLLNSDVEYDEAELIHCKKRLSEFGAKIKHLTDLLADAEQDLAKHAQLNQILKEEIRRHQRSVEREEHAENLEYLKNVVFKFLTLNNGDEKSHLVPVLNTILKLSPEETQKLNAVAKGTDIRGWGSYLPLWSNNN